VDCISVWIKALFLERYQTKRHVSFMRLPHISHIAAFVAYFNEVHISHIFPHKLTFLSARDSEWQWHQLGYMQVCTLLQTGNYVSTLPLSFLQAGCPFCRQTNSVKVLKAAYLVFVWSAYFFKCRVKLTCLDEVR